MVPVDEQRVEALLVHWFGEGDDAWTVPGDRYQVWFGRSEATDEELRHCFGDDVRRARAGELEAWKTAPRSALALLLLLDQLPRNLFRGTPDAFASDPDALGLARAMMRRGDDRALRPIERTFVYLPLEHAEDLGTQRLAVAAFRALVEEAPGPARAAMEKFLDYAIQHEVIIERFGRFPHRNAILGRASTPEEQAFLLEPNSSF